MISIATLGPDGSDGCQAARKYAPDATLHFYNRIPDIINAFTDVKGFVPLIYKDALRMPVAFNKCLNAASGEWFVKLDADDIVSYTHIEDLVKDALAMDVDMVFGNFSQIKGGVKEEIPTNIEQVLFSNPNCTIYDV